jgi:hypothetical protein
MRQTLELERLLTQVNCRITSIMRRRDQGRSQSSRPNEKLNGAWQFAPTLCDRLMVKNLPLTPRQG